MCRQERKRIFPDFRVPGNPSRSSSLLKKWCSHLQSPWWLTCFIVFLHSKPHTDKYYSCTERRFEDTIEIVCAPVVSSHSESVSDIRFGSFWIFLASEKAQVRRKHCKLLQHLLSKRSNYTTGPQQWISICHSHQGLFILFPAVIPLTSFHQTCSGTIG